MTSSRTIKLHIGKSVPPGNEQHSRNIVSLWKQLGSFFDERAFMAQDSLDGQIRSYRVSLDAGKLEQRLEAALSSTDSFNSYLKEHIDNPEHRIDASLDIDIKSQAPVLAEEEAYQVATVFLQQLVMLANITLPGSIQILDASYTGAGAHRYEAQNFDARIFFGAGRIAGDNNWPALASPALDKVWAWLEDCETSQIDIAIKGINRVLFTLIKVAEQRHEYSARTVLLVIYQLELLLDCRHANSPAELRHRLRMILGDIPEAADCLTELVEVRNNLFRGNQPVRRPPLICNTTGESLKGQLCQHDSAVESGTAMVLALLQDMIAHDSQCYEFTESMSRVQAGN